jgi:hypothetical protein
VLPAKSPPKKARASPHSTIGRTTVDTDAYDLSTVAYEPARRKSGSRLPVFVYIYLLSARACVRALTRCDVNHSSR